MALQMRLRRKLFLLPIVTVALLCGWIYWNRPRMVDMARYVPSDCLAYIEANDLTQIAAGIEDTEAWKLLAPILGARTSLLPNRWLIRTARWSGIGSINAVLGARSQVALVLDNAQATKGETTLTIKPLAALIIETHTSPRRMQSPIQKLAQDFARNVYGQVTFAQKQDDGVEVDQWSTTDGARRIVVAFIDTAAIIGNDESLVLKCIAVHRGKLPPLAGDNQLEKMRAAGTANTAAVFGLVTKSGVKPILQAWWLHHEQQSPEAAPVAQIFSSAIGNLIDGFSWTLRFQAQSAADRCFVNLSEGVAEKLRSNLVPDTKQQNLDLSFVPRNSESISIYRLRDLEGAWRDLNEVLASHADILAAVAARPFLRSILKPYGINDTETFLRAAGPEFKTVRGPDHRVVLLGEIYDGPTLRKLVLQRLGPTARSEQIGDAEILLSATDNWSASFDGNFFLSGPADSVRRCVETKAQSQSIDSINPFRHARTLVDVSLPITSLTFSSDREAAISFVELFSHDDRLA